MFYSELVVDGDVSLLLAERQPNLYPSMLHFGQC